MNIRLTNVVITIVAGLTLFAPHASAGDPTSFWDDLLENYDTNGDGRITGAEWAAVWNDVTDDAPGSDGYLTITHDELVDWLIANGRSVNVANDMADEIMRDYDKNGDGVLSPAEFNKFVREKTPGAEPNKVPILPVPIPE